MPTIKRCSVLFTDLYFSSGIKFYVSLGRELLIIVRTAQYLCVYGRGNASRKTLSMAKSCEEIAILLTHDIDFHGFLRHSGEAFCGIMPLILYRGGKKAPLLPTKSFLLLLLLYFLRWVCFNS